MSILSLDEKGHNPINQITYWCTQWWSCLCKFVITTLATKFVSTNEMKLLKNWSVTTWKGKDWSLMRIMGLDVGSKTVGVAISDPLGLLLKVWRIIQIDEEKGEFGLGPSLWTGEGIPGWISFVVGLPKNMNNTSGPRVEASQAYGKRLEELFTLSRLSIRTSVWSTVAAERWLSKRILAEISVKK